MYGIPAALTVAGDVQGLTVQAINAQGASASYRQVASYFQNLTDLTVDLGPGLSPATWTVTATMPVARLKVNGPIQPEYGDTFIAVLSQGLISISIRATRAYFGQAATAYEMEVPDFPPGSGYNNNWGLKTGATTDAEIFAGTPFNAPGVVPAVLRSAIRSRLITP
jgi:hypothetical protein